MAVFFREFTVNAMDVEELRRSQRRHRKFRPERPTDIPLASISASQESDDDEDVSVRFLLEFIFTNMSVFFLLT